MIYYFNHDHDNNDSCDKLTAASMFVYITISTVYVPFRGELSARQLVRLFPSLEVENDHFPNKHALKM